MRGRRLGLWLMVGLALALMAGPAGAVGIEIHGTGSWITAPTPDQSLPPYWDGDSSDSDEHANIGNWIFNTGAFATIPNDNSPALSNAEYYGNDGSAVVNFYFTDGVTGLTLSYEWAGYAPKNEFGYYTVNGNIISYTPIFSGNETYPLNKSINLPQTFGFYIKANNTTYYHTQSMYNPSGDTNFQHFAVFRDPNVSNVLYIGIEDLPESSSDKDYNDMIIKLSWQNGTGVVPLPSSVLLLGSGLVGLLAVRRRIRSRR